MTYHDQMDEYGDGVAKLKEKCLEQLGTILFYKEREEKLQEELDATKAALESERRISDRLRKLHYIRWLENRQKGRELVKLKKHCEQQSAHIKDNLVNARIPWEADDPT